MLALNQSRKEILEDLGRHPETTLCIIGGGIHGAAAARMAAWNGIPCVLVERGDYAGETSSRSSKMLHGGLRYLELLDFAQVAEGIRARENLFVTAPHLCHPEPFLIPVASGKPWFRWKLGLGLWLYDRLGAPASRRHGYLSREEALEMGYRYGPQNIRGAFVYTDGLTNDARLTLESALQARQQGARCLNYLEVTHVQRVGGRFAIYGRDRLGSAELEIVAERVLNCAGPWAAGLLPAGSESLAQSVRFSAGAHLLFDRPWWGPSLFLPMSGNSRYYFVWPHPGGTLVGTSEREVAQASFDPMPAREEVEEILARLAADLPDAGLDRTTLFYAYAGIRTLPASDKQSETARLSRRHRWIGSDGFWTLLGGKLTTANSTAAEGVRLAVQGLHAGPGLQSLQGIPYPGAGNQEFLREMAESLVRESLPENHAELLVRRFGARPRFLLADKARLELLAPQLTRGEVELALEEEQAETLEDILRRRTEIETLPGAALPALEALRAVYSAYKPSSPFDAQADAYRHRLSQLQAVLGKQRG